MISFPCYTEMGPVDDGVQNAVPGNAGGAGAGTPPATVTVRKDFPDTWIFKSIQTELVDGRMDRCNAWIDGWMDGCSRWIDGCNAWMDAVHPWVDGWVVDGLSLIHISEPTRRS